MESDQSIEKCALSRDCEQTLLRVNAESRLRVGSYAQVIQPRCMQCMQPSVVMDRIAMLPGRGVRGFYWRAACRCEAHWI